jgi:hypothetical protein
VVVSSFNSADFVTLNSMDWLSSRTVPVAVISQEPFLGTQETLALLYSLFALLKSPDHAITLWKYRVWCGLFGGHAKRHTNPQPQTINNRSCFF